MNEIWKSVSGFNDKYQISSFGRVRNLHGKILKPICKNGYLTVDLYHLKHNYVYIHRLVAIAFLPNDGLLPQVNHKDENKHNNHVENLEWCSVKYNANYGTRNFRISKQINQYSVDGNFLQTFRSAMDVERQLGFKNQNIINCCLGKQKTSNGYIWKYKEEN